MLILMVLLKRTLKLSSLILNIIVLMACEVATPVPEVKTIATTVPSATSVMATLTTPPTISITTTPLLATSALDPLRMAYVVRGNLYLQDGDKSPLQLTHSGQDAIPLLSDDGEKVIFYRGKLNDNNNVYSVDHDGSQEKALITNDWLSALGSGTKVGPLVFVPGTHQLLFNTYLCPEDLSLGCTNGLFLGDVDTGEIRQILAPSLDGHLPFGGDLQWRGNFSVSPDGKLLSVASAGHIDILDIAGNVIYPSILTYIRSTPIELFPRIYWLPDSTGLIIALPA